jgi:hypothetical protein
VRGYKKTPKRGGDAVDLDADGFPESGQYAAESDEGRSRMEQLDRDSFGRRRT